MGELDTKIYLKEKGLNITAARLMVLAAFEQYSASLTHKKLMQMLGANIDKVTIYRTLDVFLKYGIVHTLPSQNHTIRYAFSKSKSAENNKIECTHFECTKCGSAVFLDTGPLPKVILPLGFISKEVDIMVKGICNTCNII